MSSKIGVAVRFPTTSSIGREEKEVRNKEDRERKVAGSEDASLMEINVSELISKYNQLLAESVSMKELYHRLEGERMALEAELEVRPSSTSFFLLPSFHNHQFNSSLSSKSV